MTTPLEIIRRDGWCKGDWTNAEGQHCINGAVLASGLVGHKFEGFRTVVAEVIAEQFPDRWFGSVLRFNDMPSTTAADVEQVLEKAQIIYAERVQDVSGAI